MSHKRTPPEANPAQIDAATDEAFKIYQSTHMPFADAVAEGMAAAILLREESAKGREAEEKASWARRPPTPRLQAAPETPPNVPPPEALGTLAGLSGSLARWMRGNTSALDLADWVMRLEEGWSYAVGADLWVWVTLREGATFSTTVQDVEDVLRVLADAESVQEGKRYVLRPRGGQADLSQLAADARADGMTSMTGALRRAKRDGLVYGPNSALAWAAPAPWHFVVRSRAARAVVSQELVGHSLTIAPTPAGRALAAWAAAYTTDTVPRVTRATETLRAANAASVASANCDASTSRDANAPTAPASPARRSVLAEFIKPEYIAEAAAQRAAGVLQPQLSTEELERFALSGSLARLQERRALWRAYKRKMDAPDWQVGF